jgi:2',3'-cyclic-nucleotide 2'-phosphodiesterase/3'-nucleotidase
VRLCEELGYDLVLTGHQHMPVEAVRLGGTHAVQPPAGAGRYCAITVEEEQGSVQIASQFQPAGNQHPEEPYNTLLPLEEEVQRWLDLPVGRLSEPVLPENKLDAALAGSRVAGLFNQVQLAATAADFACTSLGNEPVGLVTEVTMRSITAAYLFPNTLVVLQVTQQDLKEALERCAAYFTLQDGQPCIAEDFLKPKIEHYNYDFYAGLSYTFDLRRPVGQRVIKLCRADGSPLGPGPFRLCTSNYRATGTGGYEVLSRCKVLWRGTEEMPQLAAEYLRRNSPLPPLVKNGPIVLW